MSMKYCTEYIQGTQGSQYKFRMMEISCEDPTYEFRDSQSLLFNASLYALILEKKSNVPRDSNINFT